MTDVDDWHETERLHAEQGRGDPFAAAVRATRMPMIITDPRQHDNPIVFANTAFLNLSGYDRSEVIGRNCRFLQGPDTNRASVQLIREAVEAKRDIAVDLLNYRKDGTSFWNALYLSPVRSAAGEMQFYFASQLDITDRVEAQLHLAHQQEALEREVSRRTRALEDALAAKTMLVHEVDHRVKNNLQMIAAILGMQTRTVSDPTARAVLEGMLQRVESIGTVHRRLYQSHDVRAFDLAEFIRDISHELLNSSGRGVVELRLELEPAMVPAQKASPVALLLNELMTNAMRHAFPAGRGGTLRIAMTRAGDGLTVVVQDDGVGMAANANPGSGFGSRLIRPVTRQLQGTVSWKDAAPGTVVEIFFPLPATDAADGPDAA